MVRGICIGMNACRVKIKTGKWRNFAAVALDDLVPVVLSMRAFSDGGRSIIGAFV